MEGRRFLQDILYLKVVTSAKADALDELRVNYGVGSMDYSRPVVQSTKGGSNVERIAERLCEAETQYTKSLSLYNKNVEDAEKLFTHLSKTIFKCILRMHYIENMSFLRISDILQKSNGEPYSYQYVYNAHSMALKEFEGIFKKFYKC